MKFSSFEKFEDRYRKNSDLLNSDFNKSSMLIQAAWTERQLQKAEQLKKEESMVKSLTAQLESQIKEKYEKERALLM
jgi:hypothetical protein